MAAILACAASAEDLEVVLSHLQGEGSTVDRLGHPASGKIVQLCEVLSSEELYAVRDER
jgi:hypothetical protein